MSRLLYIQASPRKDMSYSRAVADAFVESYRKNHPDDAIDVLDLFETDLPAFDRDALNAKYTILRGGEHSQKEKDAWEAVVGVIQRFKKADKYVIAVPMWNFGIPYRLKHYLDLIIQPGYTFSFSEEDGYTGLAGGKPVLAIYARGGEYHEGTDGESMDFQKKYLDLALGFIGLTDVKSIIVEPTLMGGNETAEEKKSDAIKQAQSITL